MEAYICPVCKMKFDLDAKGLQCPRCRYPVKGYAGDTPEDRAAEEKEIRAYRRKHWADGKVYLKVYTHRFTDEKKTKVRCEKEEELFLGSTREMKVGECRWQSENFAHLSGECTLGVRVAQEDMEDENYTLRVPNPGGQGFWRVALCRKNETDFALLVGTPEEYRESERFAYPRA